MNSIPKVLLLTSFVLAQWGHAEIPPSLHEHHQVHSEESPCPHGHHHDQANQKQQTITMPNGQQVVITPRCEDEVQPETAVEMVCTTQSDGHYFTYKTRDSAEMWEVWDRKSFAEMPRAIAALVNACVGGGRCSHSVDCTNIAHCLCVANVECSGFMATAPLYVIETQTVVTIGEGRFIRKYRLRSRNREVGETELLSRCQKDLLYTTDARLCSTNIVSRMPNEWEDDRDGEYRTRAQLGGTSDSAMLRITEGAQHDHSTMTVGTLRYSYFPEISMRLNAWFEKAPARSVNTHATEWKPFDHNTSHGQSPTDSNLYGRDYR